MKRIFTLVAMATFILISNAQVLNYNELGILFSKDEYYGTARFNALSGAFGALGNDLSATDINPAGGAVSRENKFSLTLSNKTNSTTVNYYGDLNTGKESSMNIAQAGGIFVFDIFNSNWKRLAFTFNYQRNIDFNNSYFGRGNSNFLFYDQHIDDNETNPNIFDRSLGQGFSNKTRGSNSSFNIGISAVHDKKLYVGASLKFHNLEFTEQSLLSEINDDIDGNILEVEDVVERFIEGNGFSFNLGFIYKIHQFIRIGASYESPTWYQETFEDFSGQLTMFEIPNLNLTRVQERFFEGPYSLRFTTPSKLTASGAFIFGKRGLISVDYTYKNMQNFNYQEIDLDLTDANRNFTNNFSAIKRLALGTEWRFDRLSLRGGYSYETNPNILTENQADKDKFETFSGGIGYNFGNTKIDLSYQKMENRAFYTLYNSSDIQIDRTTSRIAATIVLSL